MEVVEGRDSETWNQCLDDTVNFTVSEAINSLFQTVERQLDTIDLFLKIIDKYLSYIYLLCENFISVSFAYFNCMNFEMLT